MMIRGVRLLIKKSKHFKGIHFLACIKNFSLPEKTNIFLPYYGLTLKDIENVHQKISSRPNCIFNIPCLVYQKRSRKIKDNRKLKRMT